MVAPLLENWEQLPTKLTPSANAGTKWIRWPGMRRIILTDFWVAGYFCCALIFTALFVSTYFFHFDLAKRERMPAAKVAEMAKTQMWIVLGVYACAPLIYLRARRLTRLISHGVLCRAEYLKRGVGSKNVCRMDIAYTYGGKRFEKAKTIAEHICERAEQDGEIDILVDPKRPSQYIFPPHVV